ncbi:hypothetical protein [Nocardioides sp.]|uniref:hypothetical protein n=1 Tax=Nocardioides sp. TaxID=35761 RepID=UPI002638ED9B|nr:hypothetical protein [Nocardioides sp.]
MASRLYGPLISTDDPQAHRDHLAAAFGLAASAPTRLDDATTAALFGRAAGAWTEIEALPTPGVQAGVVLVRFAAPGEPLRGEATRLHLDAFRVIDFYAPDFDAALAHMGRVGYPMASSTAAYEVAEGAFREAHHAGADHVMTALLSGPREFFAEFAEVQDRTVSEPLSISLPLTDAAATTAFYADVFGWGVVYECDFDDTSFSRLIGIEERLRVRARAFGPSREQTYVNLVDYGLPAGTGGSLAGRSVAPARGVLGLVIVTDELDDVRARAGRSGEVVEVDLAPFGRCRAVALTSPIGAPHLVVECR